MTPRDEHPDRRAERWDALDNEDLSRQRRADRARDYTPADERVFGSPQITTPMLVLARTVLEGPDYDRRDAARVLAELVLEAAA